jgi:hypothetical protein
MRVIRYGADHATNLPVSGEGAALVAGALLKRGATPASYNGMLILADGASAIPDHIGILKEAHAAADDTLIAGTVFTTRKVELTIPYRVVRAEYDQATAATVACTQAVSTTTLTLASLEDDIDAAFLYVAAGTGAGQTNYLTASAAGSCTLKAAFTTDLDTSSYIVKILPRFHKLLAFNSAATKLASQAAAGAVKGFVIDTIIEIDGHEKQMSPVRHAALTGLAASGRSTKIWADICITDSGPYPVA